MEMHENADALWRRRYSEAQAQIAGADAAELSGVTGALHRLCRGLTANLAVMGAAINLMSAGGSDGVAAASDDRSKDVDELQFTAGEGPGLDAFAARRPVLTPDLRSAAGQRWPAYTPAALSAGVGAVFAFPLNVGAAGFGVLDVYAERPGSLSSEQIAMALTFAQIATEILVDGDLTTAGGELDRGLSHALDYRAEIHQAQGMAMVDLKMGPGGALIWMRAHAFVHDKTLIDLARKIIAGFDLSEADHD